MEYTTNPQRTVHVLYEIDRNGTGRHALGVFNEKADALKAAEGTWNWAVEELPLFDGPTETHTHVAYYVPGWNGGPYQPGSIESNRMPSRWTTEDLSGGQGGRKSYYATGLGHVDALKRLREFVGAERLAEMALDGAA